MIAFINYVARTTQRIPAFELFRDMLDELDNLKPLCDELTEPTICHHDFNVWDVTATQNQSLV